MNGVLVTAYRRRLHHVEGFANRHAVLKIVETHITNVLLGSEERRVGAQIATPNNPTAAAGNILTQRCMVTRRQLVTMVGTNRFARQLRP